MAKEQKGFCLFFDWVERLKDLEGDEAFAVICALDAYYRAGENPVEKFKGALKVVVGMMFDQIKRAEAEYEKRALAGRAGGNAQAMGGNAQAMVSNAQAMVSNAQAMVSNAQATETNTETETNTNTETNTDTFINTPFSPPLSGAKKSEAPKSRKRSVKDFVPPTYDEVVKYAASRGREDIAKVFFDYFTEGKWLDSEGKPVLAWKQKFITWCSKNKKDPKAQSSIPKHGNYDSNEAFRIALERTANSDDPFECASSDYNDGG